MVGDSERRMFGAAARGLHPLRSLSVRARIMLGMTAANLDGGVKQALRRIERLDLADKFPAERTTFKRASRAFLAMLDGLAAEAGCAYWVEKTPSHVHYLAEISKYDPDARFAHIIRDGREVAASMRVAGQKFPDAHWSRLYDSAERMVARWNKAISDSLHWRDDPRHVFVRYEDLIESPGTVIRGVCERIGLPFDPVMVEGHGSTSNRITTKDEPWKEGVSGTIKGRSKGRFQDVFTADEKKLITEQLLDLSSLNAIFAS